jgi:small subunit ribosomal protein S9
MSETSNAKTGKYFYANGKRKSAVARVKLYKGKGEVTVNDKTANVYFPIKELVATINTPFKITGSEGQFDVVAKVAGGGISAQADAIRHGISKALVTADILNKPTLRKAGLLTRDSRTKERKKFGLKRARKAPQFSKR